MDLYTLEKPLVEIANKIKQLKLEQKQSQVKGSISEYDKKITQHLEQFKKKAAEVYKNLTSYQITQIARHSNRPNTTDIIKGLCSDFIELHGDRNFRDDQSIITGLGKFRNGTRIAIIGQQKGRNTKENILRNFGMPKPEGYRKALRIMKLAEQFSLPIITFIDTPGAYPGIDAEERGQSEAIAKNILVMSRLSVPIITVIIGEGGSGGALAIAVGNRVLMLEYSVYSVISPEGCASILWKDGTKANQAADLLKITSNEALKHGIVDEVIKEPIGGAHWNHTEAIEYIGLAIEKNLLKLQTLSAQGLKDDRKEKYFKIGSFTEKPPISPFHSKQPILSQWNSEWIDE